MAAIVLDASSLLREPVKERAPLNADAWVAVAAGATVFALYVWTMPRDVLLDAGIDSAKFAYMPRVLGVPHAPGYPLYLLIGWAFSWLPIGTLAFRMCLLSACFGALAVGLAARILGELQCSRSICLSVAVLFGLGRLFWSQAIVAEVYTLHIALVAGMLLALLVWQRTRRDRALYVAVLCFALGLAHHTDIAVFGPAMVLFVFKTDRRAIHDPRVLATAGAICVSALSLYAYTIVRTRQGAPFVEAGATDWAGLVALVSGRQFHYLFQVPGVEAAGPRLMLLGAFFMIELKRLGVALGLIGLVALGRWHRSAFAFVVLGAAGMIGFTIVYHAFDVEVFLLPVILLSWLCVGVGAEALHRAVSAQRLRWRQAPLLVPGVLLVWSGWYPFKNFAPNNLRVRTSDARFLDHLLDQLPGGSALVDAEIAFSHMVLYKVLGQGAAGKPLILVVPPLSRELVQFGFVHDDDAHRVVRGGFDAIDRLRRTGHEVIAFRSIAAWLRTAGFGLEPVRLLDQPLPGYLANLPSGLIIAAAVPATAADDLSRWAQPFRAIGGLSSVQAGRCEAVIGVTGERRNALEASGALGQRVDALPGVAIGASRIAPLVHIEARCDRDSATIAINGAEVAWGDSSVPVVVMNQYGAIQTSANVTPATLYRVPFEWPRLATFRVVGPRVCASVGPTWSDISRVAQGAVSVRPPPSGILMYFTSDVRPRFPTPVMTKPFTVAVNTLDTSDANDAARLQELLTDDALDESVLRARRYVSRVEVDRDAESTAGSATSLNLTVGVAHPAALARSIGSSTSAEACQGTLRLYDLFAGCIDCLESVPIDRAGEELFGAGWHDFDSDSAGGVRWAEDEDAHLLLPIGKMGAIRVSLRAEPPEGDTAGRSLTLIVNGHELRALPLQAGASSYEWSVPAELWQVGVNDVIVRTRGVDGAGDVASRRFVGVRRILAKLVDATLVTQRLR